MNHAVTLMSSCPVSIAEQATIEMRGAKASAERSLGGFPPCWEAPAGPPASAAPSADLLGQPVSEHSVHCSGSFLSSYCSLMEYTLSSPSLKIHSLIYSTNNLLSSYLVLG